MRILLIEDETDVVASVRAAIAAEVVVAATRDAAYQVLEADHDFDLVICDLMIPPYDGANMVKGTEHGFAVHHRCREVVPGVPVRFYSGKATLENMTDVLSANEQVDLFGESVTRPLISIHQKNRPLALVDEVADMEGALRRLERSIALSSPDPVSDMARRAICLIGRRAGATRAEVRNPGGGPAGLSGAETLAVVFHDDADALRARCFLKVDDRGKIEREIRAFHSFIPTLLTDGFTPLGEVIMHGLRAQGAAAYTLADGFDQSLLWAPSEDPIIALAALDRLMDDTQPWRSIRERRLTTIRDLRRAVVADELVVAQADWSELFERYEASTVEVGYSVAHGDLHGGNVLVRPDGEPILIDFGDVGLHPVGQDAVTLELSFLFHPARPSSVVAWSGADVGRHFFEPDRYLDGCPVSDFLSRVRGWAVEESGDSDLLAAVVYAHAMRQLKYIDTDHDLAWAVAGAAVALAHGS
jgi:CheY-like chemotaxis protein